jgi:RNA polymerase sigma-70 factor (ECF subfamily)
LEDTALAAAAAEGDQQAFATLFERYRLLVYTIAYKILLHEDDALDATQNVFAKVARDVGQFRGHGSFKGWLARIASNEAFSILRNPRRRETPTEPEEMQMLIDKDQANNHNVRQQLDERKKRLLVHEAMAELSPQQRAIVALQFLEDIGPAEIAERLNMPAGQVRSQLFRAVQKLKGLVA